MRSGSDREAVEARWWFQKPTPLLFGLLVVLLQLCSVGLGIWAAIRLSAT